MPGQIDAHFVGSCPSHDFADITGQHGDRLLKEGDKQKGRCGDEKSALRRSSLGRVDKIACDLRNSELQPDAAEKEQGQQYELRGLLLQAGRVLLRLNSLGTD